VPAEVRQMPGMPHLAPGHYPAHYRLLVSGFYHSV